MIPFRLNFSGIRDYTPVSIDLSGINDHIYITGPNGAGKSTITFCMGAVLYSSKVDLEGLRSQNLPEHETWRGRIEFVFQNIGPSQIDAYAYVQFSLLIEQTPGKPMIKEFIIQEGNVLDQWESETVFTSGHRDYNFSEYRNRLKTKYKIDPDTFYLIWYQNEVNQFAAMDPRERFRIFSEMNKIDHIQKQLEEMKELVKEGKAKLVDAELQQKVKKQELSIKEEDLRRFNERNELLENGLQKYVSGLRFLISYYKEQIGSSETTVGLLQDEIEEVKSNQQSLTEEKICFENKHELDGKESKLLDSLISELKERMKELDETRKEKTRLKEALEEEIAEINKQVSQIPYSKEIAFARKEEVDANVNLLLRQLDILKEQRETETEKKDDLNDECITLKIQLENVDKERKRHEDVITTYKNSHTLNTKIITNQKQIQIKSIEKEKLEKHIVRLKDELKGLNSNQDFSERQLTVLKEYKSSGLEVFTLNQLVELEDNANPSIERMLDPIKYTIFVNSKTIVPKNDLYHVCLPTIIPEKYIDRIEDLSLRVKRDLDEKTHSFAVKILYWISQFFQDEQPYLKNVILIDQRGLRGPQEEHQFILSHVALVKRKEEKEAELTNCGNRILELKEEVDNLNEEQTNLHSAFVLVKNAEAFMAKESKRQIISNQFEIKSEQLEKIKEQLFKIETEIETLSSNTVDLKAEKKIVDQYVELYKKFEEEQDKIVRIQGYQKELQRIKNDTTKLKIDLEEMSQKRDKILDEIDEIAKKLRELKNELEDLDSKLKQKINERNRRIEELEQQKNNYIVRSSELDRLKDIASEELFKQEIPELNETSAISSVTDGKREYEFAKSMTNIDEAAPENYEAMKTAFEQSEREVQSSKILLVDYEGKETNLFNHLETLINMKVLEVNQKFAMYMTQFGFEGQVAWDMYEDKRSQIHYQLFLKARKEGHRGKMEDVSTKARGNKVGKGVSGGEKSLSSLLFALALLQTIETHPGYIVLDEFDSALDEHRKAKVFSLYKEALQRKLIILSPKSHEEEYLNQFNKAFIVYHEPQIPRSSVFKLKKRVTS